MEAARPQAFGFVVGSAIRAFFGMFGWFASVFPWHHDRTFRLCGTVHIAAPTIVGLSTGSRGRVVDWLLSIGGIAVHISLPKTRDERATVWIL
jgi:hypothetical protein